MKQFFLSSWRAGFRGRSFYGVFFLGVALVGVAYLAASFSPRQPQTVALDVGFSGFRLALSLFAIVLVQDLVGREIDRRTVVLTLAYPAGRSTYVCGRYAGVLALVAAASIVLAMLLWIAVLAASPGYDRQFAVLMGWPYWIAVGGIWLDVAVVAAFTLWISTVSTVAVLPLALGIVFAIASRALGAVFDYISHGADGQEVLAARAGPILDVARWLVPDLSHLDWRIWPMYGTAPDPGAMALGVVLALSYAGVMVGLAVHAFSRREFS